MGSRADRIRPEINAAGVAARTPEPGGPSARRARALLLWPAWLDDALPLTAPGRWPVASSCLDLVPTGPTPPWPLRRPVEVEVGVEGRAKSVKEGDGADPGPGSGPRARAPQRGGNGPEEGTTRSVVLPEQLPAKCLAQVPSGTMKESGARGGPRRGAIGTLDGLRRARPHRSENRRPNGLGGSSPTGSAADGDQVDRLDDLLLAENLPKYNVHSQ